MTILICAATALATMGGSTMTIGGTGMTTAAGELMIAGARATIGAGDKVGLINQFRNHPSARTAGGETPACGSLLKLDLAISANL